MRETTLTLQFESQARPAVAIAGGAESLDADQGPLLLLHPGGPLGTVRSGMMLADVTPALQPEAEALRGDLQELADLRGLQTAAGETLGKGLQAAQEARAALSPGDFGPHRTAQAVHRRPRSAARPAGKRRHAGAFSGGLSPQDSTVQGFAEAKGALPLPVLGTHHAAARRDRCQGRDPARRDAGHAAAGAGHSPWPATIRYRGPLLDYGNVMILEPGGGYL